MMTLWPCIYCTTRECRDKQKPIPLPFAMPAPPVSHPKAWPTDNSWLYVACPECKRVSAHCAYHQIQFDRDQPESENLWIRISFECGHEGCETPVQFHVILPPTMTQTTFAELNEKLNSGYWKGAFPCGHPIATTADQKVEFARPGGTLQGYNPEDPYWLSF
jgi:hypothetical protein